MIALHRYKYRNQINTLEYFIYYVSKNVTLFCRMLKLIQIVLTKCDAIVWVFGSHFEQMLPTLNMIDIEVRLLISVGELCNSAEIQSNAHEIL